MSDAARPDWSGRFRALRHTYTHDRLDALVVSTPANLRYLTGFAGSAGVFVLTGDAGWLVVDGRYTGAVGEGIAAGELASVRMEKVEQRVDQTLAGLLHRVGAKRIGFEAAHVTVATLRSWQGLTSGVEWLPTERLVERRRVVKDRFELDVLRRAAVLLSEVARQLGQLVAAGRSERDVARDIDAALDRAGFSEPAFPTIVASGPNSAHPHARPTDRRLADGDLVVLDFGGVLDGYCVDLTRMAAVGQVSARARALFEAVHDAHRPPRSRPCAPASPASAVDAAARRVLEARGLADAFLHSTGHGLGLEVHEAPRLSRRADRARQRCWRPGWSSRSNQGRTSKGSAGYGWRTTCS